MKVPGLRSPHDKVGGIVYFGRMLDKIRLKEKGALPAGYHENLGKAFDDLCANLVGKPYAEIAAHVKGGASDEETLMWCQGQGRRLTEQDILVWNEFMRKRGWNDSVTERLRQRKAESGLSHRDDILTMFDYIDADEELR